MKKKVMKKREATSKTVGKVQTVLLDKVEPNDWNPNRFDDFTFQSLVHGLKTDGWIASQSLLVWRTDENDEEKMIIIDGEHRWKAAKEAGFQRGPAVFLDGLTEAEAKALTVKLDSKRGEFDPLSLGTLIDSIREDYVSDNFYLELGVPEKEAQRLMLASKSAEISIPDVEVPEIEEGLAEKGRSASVQVRSMKLDFPVERYEQFVEDAKVLALRHGTSSVTDTICRVFRAAADADE